MDTYNLSDDGANEKRNSANIVLSQNIGNKNPTALNSNCYLLRPILCVIFNSPPKKRKLPASEELFFIREVNSIIKSVRTSKYSARFLFYPIFFVRSSEMIQALNDIIQVYKPSKMLVHVTCHGDRSGQLCFSDMKIDADAMVSLYNGEMKHNVDCRLFFFNACSSSIFAKRIKDRCCVSTIGYNGEISSSTAATMSSTFYHELCDGQSIREAFNSAKRTCCGGASGVELYEVVKGDGGLVDEDAMCVTVLQIPKFADPSKSECIKPYNQISKDSIEASMRRNSTGLKQMNNAQHSRDVNSDVSERVRSDVERYINYDLNVLSTWQNECEKIENLSSNIKNDV